jgi:hypothetical protein
VSLDSGVQRWKGRPFWSRRLNAAVQRDDLSPNVIKDKVSIGTAATEG